MKQEEADGLADVSQCLVHAIADTALALDDAQSDEDRTGQAMIDRVESRFQELLSEHTIHEKALVVASVMRLELRDRWNDLQTRRAN